MKIRIAHDDNGNIERAFVIHAASPALTVEPLSAAGAVGAPLSTFDVELDLEPGELHEVLRGYRVDAAAGKLVKLAR